MWVQSGETECWSSNRDKERTTVEYKLSKWKNWVVIKGLTKQISWANCLCTCKIFQTLFFANQDINQTKHNIEMRTRISWLCLRFNWILYTNQVVHTQSKIASSTLSPSGVYRPKSCFGVASDLKVSQLKQGALNSAFVVGEVANDAHPVVVALEHQVVLCQHMGSSLQNNVDLQLVCRNAEAANDTLSIMYVHIHQIPNWRSAFIEYLTVIIGLCHHCNKHVRSITIIEQCDYSSTCAANRTTTSPINYHNC